MLLTASKQLGRDLIGTQNEAQTSRPFLEIFFLAGEAGRPKCASTCR